MSIYILLLILSGVVPVLLDIHSTNRNQTVDGIKEKTKLFRRPDGKCDMPKLILFNVVALACLIAFGFLMMQYADAGIIGFIALPILGFYRLAIAMNNYKLHRYYTKDKK